MKSKLLLKRSLAMLTAASMVLSLAACGNEEKENDSKKEVGDSSEAQNVEQSEAEDYDPFGAYEETLTVGIGRATLEVVGAAEGETHDDNSLKDYIKEKLNVDYYYPFEALNGEDYARQVSLALTSGEMPDMMVVTDKNTLNELVENDMVADLTEVYENYASDGLKAIYDGYGVSPLEKATYNGKLMAIPRSAPEIGTMMYIRQDWIDALGLPIDEDGDQLITRDELELIASEFVKNDPGKSGNPVGFAVTTALGDDPNLSMTAVFNSFGAFTRRWFVAEDGSVYNGSTLPEVKEALAWWADMYERDILDAQFGMRSWDDLISLLVNDQLGICFAELGFVVWAMGDKVLDADFRAYYLDDGSGKSTGTYYDTTNRWLVVRKDYEHPEVAIKLMNIVNDMMFNDPAIEKENPILYSYLAGSVWQYFDPTYVGALRADEGMKYAYQDTVSYLNGELAMEDITYPLTKQVINFVKKYNEDPTSLTVSEKGMYIWVMDGLRVRSNLEETGKLVYLSPLALGTTETMNSKQADLYKLEDETIVKIITGEESLDYFDDFVEEYNEMGGEQIRQELQERLDNIK